MKPMPLSPEQFQSLYPKVMGWIDLRLAMNRGAARSVTSAGFKRLPDYFPKVVLDEARYVIVDKVPVPPLADLGLKSPAFQDFELMVPAGITYRQTFFVRKEAAGLESLYLHELIHVLQWNLLGPEGFVMRYAAELEQYGYDDSPLEKMAYTAEDRFKNGEVFDAVRYVMEQIG